MQKILIPNKNILFHFNWEVLKESAALVSHQKNATRRLQLSQVDAHEEVFVEYTNLCWDKLQSYLVKIHRPIDLKTNNATCQTSLPKSKLLEYNFWEFHR